MNPCSRVATACRSCVLICLLFTAIPSLAQQPVADMEALAAKAPIEKVYLHTDRETYFAGETVWLKAYLYSEFYPDTISTSLHIELLDNNSRIVKAVVYPVLFATSAGQIELPDTLVSGKYFLRAYSSTMLNYGEELTSMKMIQVAGKTAKKTTAPAATNKKSISFFPESGTLLQGIDNTVAFKITDAGGNPLDLGGAVKNQKGELVDSFASYHNGMGSFVLKPVAGETYHVVLENDDAGNTYELPAASATGVVLRLHNGKGGKNFELHSLLKDSLMKPAYILGQMQHHPTFKFNVDGSKRKVSGFIDTKKLSSGVLHITIFNKDNMPLAERLCFVSNDDYNQPAGLLADTLDFAEKAKNKFILSLPPNVAGSFSVSVTDAGFTGEALRNESIHSGILLSADLKGYIHQPGWYFAASTPADSAASGLDLLLMTHGWTRFQWNTISQQAKKPAPYKDGGFITITGQVNIRDRKKPLPNKDLLMVIFSQNKMIRPAVGFLKTDAEGKFRIDSMIFFGATRFRISDMVKKGEKWLDVLPDKDSLPLALSLKPANSFYRLPTYYASQAVAGNFSAEYDLYQNELGKVLEGVTVKANKKSPLQQVEDRYISSGLFAGDATHTMDLINTSETMTQMNIFEYIEHRIPGLRVERDGIDYTILYRQNTSLTQGQLPMTLFLDEVQTDPSVIASIPADQIALVKVFSNFVGAAGNGAGGTLAIYTKKGEDFTRNSETSADIFQYKGYSIVKTFYSPDYSAGQEAGKADNRITLYWLADIFTNGATRNVPFVFYNNDRTKSFKVVVEGMTTDGRLLTIEKIFKPKAF